uniref:tetratricopeptide repeat protein n=1 Tax=Microcoleus sp. TaxID=44472 RepID=UPI00359387A9
MLDKIWRFLKQLIQRILCAFGKDSYPPLTPPLVRGGDKKENLSSTLGKGGEQNLASPLSKGGLRGVPPTLSDAEYEAKLMELLEGVNQGWGRGDVAEFLMAKRIENGDLAAWLRRFGDRLLEGAQGSTASTDAVVSLQKLARRLELLGRVAGGELSEVAGNVGREILVVFPLVSVEGDEGGEDVDGEAKAWCDRGIEQYEQSNFQEALTFYERSIELNYNQPEVWEKRGLVLQKLGDYQGAIDSNNTASTLYRYLANPESASVPQSTEGFFNPSNIKPSYDKALEFQADDDETWYDRCDEQYYERDFEEASASYDKALEIKPDSYEAWFNRGLALRKLGRLEEAIASYDKALEIKPDLHEAWNNRGIILCDHLKEYEKAIASYDKALEIEPNFHFAWINRSIAVKNAPKHRLLVYELLQAKFPKSPPVTRTLLTHNLTQRGYEGQVLTLKAGLEYCRQNTHPEGYGELHRALGNAHYSRGQLNDPNTYWNKAAASYKEALKTLTPDTFLKLHLEVLQKLIKTLVSLKQTDEANKLRRYATELLQRLLKDEDYSQLSEQQLNEKLIKFQQLTVNIFIQSGQFTEALATAETDKNVCLSWLLDALPIPDYETEKKVTHAQIQQLINPTTAAIYWHLSDASLTTFIIKSDGLLSPENCFSDFPDEFEKWVKEWNQQYTDYQSKQKEGQQNHPWRAGIESKFARLNAILKIDVIEQQLEGITKLILIPHRDLHRFPIHALFSRDFVVSYLPSAAVGINLQHRFTPPQPP